MSTGSSGCVLNKVSQIFTCEKKCNSVASRKALLEDFTSKRYNAEVVFVDNDGKTAEENYRISFQLSEKQKDSEMIRVHGNAIIQKEEETPIKCSWSAIYLEKKHGYKVRLVGDNIEKDFYLYCHGNDKIHFLIKITFPQGELKRSRSLFGKLWKDDAGFIVNSLDKALGGNGVAGAADLQKTLDENNNAKK